MTSGTPISRPVQPRFGAGSGLQSPLSNDALTNDWKKTKVPSNSTFGLAVTVSKLVTEMGKLRRRIVSPPLQQTPTEAFYPFKIYQPSNVSSFTTGLTFLDPSSGVATVCNIDATKATDFTATPPTVNPSETWRFWAVRSGQVEIRPIYSLLTLGNEYTNDDGDVFENPNNYGWKVTVNTNADGVNPTISDLEFDDSTDATFFPPIIMNDGGRLGDNARSLFLLINITMDTSNTSLPSVAINGFQGTGASQEAWPDSNPTLIPIGLITNQFGQIDGFGNYGLSFLVDQLVFDHQTNLFPKGNGNFLGNPSSVFANQIPGGVMNFRGNYSGYAPVQPMMPADLTSQVMYLGDVTTAYYNTGNVIPSAGTVYILYWFRFSNDSPAFFIDQLIDNNQSIMISSSAIL